MRCNAPNVKFTQPANEVFKRIEIRAPLRQMNVLEPFGGDGTTQTLNYAFMPFVDGVESWDINPECKGKLKQYIPGAEAKTCNAYDEVHKLHPTFDVIIIDNNLIQVPFEHFTLFPAILKGLKDHSFLVVSVCTDPGGYYVQRERIIRQVLGTRVDSWVKDWDHARTMFYEYNPVLEVDYKAIVGRIMPLSTIPAEDMVEAYMDRTLKAGFFTKYRTIVGRSRWMKYILFELDRAKPESQRFDLIKDKMERSAVEESNKP